MFQRFGSKAGKIAPILVGSIALTSFCGFAAQSTPSTATPRPINPIGQPKPIEGINWQLSQWRSNGKNLTLLRNNPITIQFDGKRLGGSTGCNSYSGDYQLQNAQLRLIGDLISTMIGCSSEVSARESHFATILRLPRLTIHRNQNRLTIHYTNEKDKGVLVFTPTQSKLQNTSWQLSSITTRSTVPARSQPPVTLKFTNNSVGGFSGCNHYNAAYQEPFNQLKIGAIASTKKACEVPQMQLEQNFLAKLATVQRYEINPSGNLRLFFQQGSQSGVLTFRPQR